MEEIRKQYGKAVAYLAEKRAAFRRAKGLSQLLRFSLSSSLTTVALAQLLLIEGALSH
jgi:hypothetical protein